MSSINDSPLCLPRRKTYSQRTEINICLGSILLFGVSEQRSEIDPAWMTLFGDENTYEVFSGNDLQTARIPKLENEWVSLRNQSHLIELFHQINASAVYLDITGLPHHIWMPLVSVCINAGVETNCIYVEPESYTYNPTPKPGEFFDLSERIRGFSPIPTFARLTNRRAEDTMLIPLLGFEGIRFRHLIETIEPSERDIAPIIGVPGFELEYPFHAFEGNATVLSMTRSWQRVSFVDAACPFALYSHLTAVQNRASDKQLQIATIGTKPHALGAMMYAMKHQHVELLYDHPIRRQGRTTGATKCHLYHVSTFMDQV